MSVALFRAVHPRTGGCSIVIKGFYEEAVPRTRGFTGRDLHAGRPVHGCPAHARVHLIMSARSASSPRLSRARAGSPDRVILKLAGLQAVPRTHGFTHIALGRGARRSGWSRARAGSPALYAVGLMAIPAVPRTRGFTHARPGAAGGRQGCPAHARVHRRRASPVVMRFRLSRARAGSPYYVGSIGLVAAAVPRTRGFTRVQRQALIGVAGCPAHAWVHPRTSRFRDVCRWFFRTRAGSPPVMLRMSLSRSVLPRTRGFTADHARHLDEGHASSAQARVPRTSCWAGSGRSGFLPRTRGFTVAP